MSKRDDMNMLDNMVYNGLCETTAPTIYSTMGITPNMITTFTLVIRLLAAYFIYSGLQNPRHFSIAAGLVLLSIFTDALDGYIARKYGLSSEFGAKYDMWTDIITYIIITIVLVWVYYIKFGPKGLWVLLPLAIINIIGGIYECTVAAMKYKKQLYQSETPHYTSTTHIGLAIHGPDRDYEYYDRKANDLKRFSGGTTQILYAMLIFALGWI
uniref:CDP-alcohol phosphatidyltransferase n=1 Tax=viral metagenome TaxID=1070528 RepID=A0A6C0CJG3_9ZZZZ